MKDKIVFISRENLSHLYGRLSNDLKNSYDVINIAYSQKERNILKYYGIENTIVFQESLDENCILVNEDFLFKINLDFENFSDTRFNLNSAIQSDRTFRFLNYTDCLLLIQKYYLFWENFFKNNEVQVIFHEPVSLMFNFIGCIISKKYSCTYASEIQVIGPNEYNLIFMENLGEINYSNVPVKEQIAKLFLEDFRKDYDKILCMPPKKKLNSIFMFLRMIKRAIYLLKNMGKTFEDNLENYYQKGNKNYQYLKNRFFYKFLKWDLPVDKDKYFLYPFHFEPEAVVEYWADGLYRNQIKLIENIAASLPPSFFLYVKDHPHEEGYRSFTDYLMLRKVPNIKIIKSSYPAKRLISNSYGLITLNGTAGFEAILLGKHVYALGNSFYKDFTNCHYIHHIKNLKEEIMKTYTNKIFDKEIISFLQYYLSTIGLGNQVPYFRSFLKHDEENYKNIFNFYIKYLEMIVK